jgi:putative FmdB family regulatory protein
MPIYEYACPKCRVIFSFLSKRVNPDRSPTCPRCGNGNLRKQVSRFAHLKGLPEPKAGAEDDAPVPDFDERKMERVMSELERDMDHLDENNPRHMAHVMKKMKRPTRPLSAANCRRPNSGSARAPACRPTAPSPSAS